MVHICAQTHAVCTSYSCTMYELLMHMYSFPTDLLYRFVQFVVPNCTDTIFGTYLFTLVFCSAPTRFLLKIRITLKTETH